MSVKSLLRYGSPWEVVGDISELLMQLIYHLRIDLWTPAFLWGLLNARKPLGHSGHRRLQLVVGSSESEIGSPIW